MANVSAYLLYRAGQVTLVDTGQEGSNEDIESVLVSLGLGWGSIGDVIVTHRHADHVGGVPAISAAAPGAKIHVGALDADSIGTLASGAPQIVGDGDRIFGLEIIETPGHTAGHISVLEPRAGILVTGDALNNRGGTLSSASADTGFTEDGALADQSVGKLADLDFEVVLFGHGDPLVTGGSAAVAELATQL